MYKSDTIGVHTVTYCAPVKNKMGQIVGVLTTRFNWNFIMDIINATQVYSDCKVYLLNSAGLVIASQDNREILKKILVSLKHLNSLWKEEMDLS